MILLTFIIPTYNTPDEWLQACLESIANLSLTTDEREIIVVDDGSEKPVDEELVKRYNGQLISQPHAGVSVARNQALKIAKGKYIQFVDADDHLIVEGYEEVLNYLMIEKPDAVGFTFYNKKRRSRPHHLCSGTYFVRHYNLFGAVWSYTFLRDKIKTMEFAPDLQHGEDELFTLKAMLEMDLVRITNIAAYNYRSNDQSVTYQSSLQAVQKRLNDHLELIKRIDWFMYYLEGKKYKAAKRRIAQLSADYLQNTRRLTHSKEKLQTARKQLKELHLYPLPLKCYTWKYLFQAIRTHL